MARHKIMTQAQHKKLGRLVEARNMAMDRVYVAANQRYTPLSKCLPMVPESVRKSYLARAKALDDFKQKMVDEGRAWFGTLGLFFPHY